MSIFDKRKLKNKDKVNNLKEDFKHKKIDIKDIPKDILVELFINAVAKIDYLENVKPYVSDERDIKDLVCDKRFIIEDLFKELEEDIKLGIYK